LAAVCVGVLLSAGMRAQSDAARRLVRVPGDSNGRRIALVVANDAYKLSPLTNAVNDGRAVASSLRNLGFDTTQVLDASVDVLDRSIEAFIAKIQPGDVALFYFSGHGLELRGENFLLPVDFAADSESQVKRRAVSATELLQRLEERQPRTRILILDACRNNPFEGSRSTGRGLAQLEGTGTLVAFATAAGKTASDNPGGGNGLFTKYLLEALARPGLGASELFRLVRERVYEASSGAQVPFLSDGLIGNFVFNAAAGANTTALAATSSIGSADDIARREELSFWDSIKDSNDQRLFREYLARYGDNGRFAVIARTRLNAPAASTPAPPAATRPETVAPRPNAAVRWAYVDVGTMPKDRAASIGTTLLTQIGAGLVFGTASSGIACARPEYNLTPFFHALTIGPARPPINLREVTRVAFVDAQRVASASTLGRQYTEQVQALTETKAQEIKRLNDSVAAVLKQLNEPGVTQDQRNGLGLAVVGQQINIDRVTEDAKREVTSLQTKLQNDFVAKFQPVLDRLCVDAGIDFALNGIESGLVWSDPSLDITSSAIAALDRATESTPVAGAPAVTRFTGAGIVNLQRLASESALGKQYAAQVQTLRATKPQQSEVDALNAKLQGDFEQAVIPIVRQLARERGLQLIFGAAGSGILASDASLDLTAVVIQRLDAR
jgi:Skp family chaperone for outer membrane proteins